VLRDRDVWTETVSTMAAQTGRLWVEKLIFALQAPATTTATTDTSATRELGRLMAQIATQEGFAAQALAEVDEVLSHLPASRRAVLMPDEAARAALAATLSEAGAEHLLALMKGASE
jgi:hypothetical protein